MLRSISECHGRWDVGSRRRCRSVSPLNNRSESVERPARERPKPPRGIIAGTAEVSKLVPADDMSGARAVPVIGKRRTRLRASRRWQVSIPGGVSGDAPLDRWWVDGAARRLTLRVGGLHLGS